MMIEYYQNENEVQFCFECTTEDCDYEYVLTDSECGEEYCECCGASLKVEAVV